MGEACSSLTQGTLAYNNIDLIPNGFINEFDEDRTGNQIRQLPSSRMQVELQYSIRSDVTGTSLNNLSPGGNAGFLLGGLSAGAGFVLGAAIGCTLVGDIEPTRSTFVFHVCESVTKLNREIELTEEMLTKATFETDGLLELDFDNEYLLGVLGVTKDPIELTEDELAALGAGNEAIRGHNITQEGLIEADFQNYDSTSSDNFFTEIIRDERKFQYRADNDISGDPPAGANAFVSASPDDITDSKLKFVLPIFDTGTQIGPSATGGQFKPGDKIYVSYVGVSKRILRQAIFCSSLFFLFPGFKTERIGEDQVKAWNFRQYSFRVNKDVSLKANLEDLQHDDRINADPELTEEEKEQQRRLEFIEGQRLVEALNDTKNQTPFIRGIYFADIRGILSFDLTAGGEPDLLVPAAEIQDQVWWQSFINGLIDFGPGFDSDGNFDPEEPGSNRLLKGFVFDVSNHVNSVCYDNDKFGYQRELASALADVSKLDSETPGTGLCGT